MIPSSIRPTRGPARRKYRWRPCFTSVSSFALASLARCPLAVCGAIPAENASSLAVRARPSSNAQRMFARAGSPTSAAISATSFTPSIDQIWACPRVFAIADTSAGTVLSAVHLAGRNAYLGVEADMNETKRALNEFADGCNFEANKGLVAGGGAEKHRAVHDMHRGFHRPA